MPESWDITPGYPATPLPEGWHWYAVNRIEKRDTTLNTYDQKGSLRHLISWNVALDEFLKPEDISVELMETDGYPWEEPYVKLHVPAYKAPYSYPVYSDSFGEPNTEGGYAVTMHRLQIELIPFGCTALRITYFPRGRHRED